MHNYNISSHFMLDNKFHRSEKSAISKILPINMLHSFVNVEMSEIKGIFAAIQLPFIWNNSLRYIEKNAKLECIYQ
ncbi:hypothetical protein T05_15731 [Trichinella murrelli]|uniref:Uncharacterized protein n=1 Tax=Trichinella murrelli TaxID=144512 RepID=A0A0V0TTR9_9BILA|nr:hypothetical protein T05_15731 [Trichinella murrelli]